MEKDQRARAPALAGDKRGSIGKARPGAFGGFRARLGENLAAENMQSRLRGVILMAISNAEGRLLLSTGNKSELAVGYCTLYGDTNGGLAVLGDVLKTEVWEVCRHLNQKAGREIIPEKSSTKPRPPNLRRINSIPTRCRLTP
ncbi:MAG: NAD(+) synthase [Blastocatellia bacterium]|nr:NAD(+) synthase [Blastocatellia bacterium]